ncbi:GTPase Era [Mycoplasmopsis synoviae]|uniref:GTPase Era n=1 Tax=Mycoplasmopsis synoviae TaxID=2109 RepID=UPI000D6A05B1|nr:GTPase Era [Mycoplasmopsis synoviae]AWL84176.1 GTPase Era [Mycoplasmopsis synoviae]QLE13897.1 GTPase Era [Mycoplasmopsis synoviae]UZF64023.1 GTPase Era [Mycoplasmopsis synoviae]UZF64694.1 GTPase Era [Mycoplasmopsis synoviae]UZF65365.1 GTPase Era [Mycoplasmopsis synoviae]
MTSNQNKICFVTIVGRPNVGKSSLLNTILGYNLSIVTPVAQTTRNQITGVYTEGNLQIIFIDTPGIHKPKSLFGEHLNKEAFDTFSSVDLVLFLSPADEEVLKGDLFILEKLKNVKNKVAVITKLDKVNSRPQLLKDKVNSLMEHDFKEIVATSIENEESIDSLVQLIEKYSYPGDFQYAEDDVTDKSVLFITKEIIRECAINNLSDELPHSIYVEIENFEEDENFLLVEGIIYVTKDSQKGMLIGKNASMIKEIGQLARNKISIQFEKRVNLFLKVKVNKNWQKDPKILKKIGY